MDTAEAQAAAITLTAHRGAFFFLKKESSSCQNYIAGLEPFLGKSRVIPGFGGLTGQAVSKSVMQFSVLGINNKTQPMQRTQQDRKSQLLTARANCTIY